MTDRRDLSDLRRTIRSQLGGPTKVRALRLAGRRTARDHVAALIDEGSWFEIGTFAGMGASGPPTAAGDGRVCGHGAVAGRPVAVIADDVTVKRATSTTANAEKAARLVHQAAMTGEPVVYFGEAGGARLPGMLRADVFAAEPIYPWLFRADRPPLVTAIVGESYGGSSLIAARSDVVVMLEGAVMALTSPRVVEVATGVAIDDQALGGAGAALGAGLVDAVATDATGLDRLLRRLVALFSGPEAEASPPEVPATALTTIVPESHTAAYDVGEVIRAVVDGGSFFELRRGHGRSVVTGLARVEGRTVGVVASQPLVEAGALSAAACEKAGRLMALCGRFGFPVVYLVDVPGFTVGPEAEQDRILERAMELVAVNTASSCPVVTVVLRKAYGLAFFAMCSPAHGGDLVVAWPGAQIGFMAPAVAANVLHAAELAGLPPTQRRDRLDELASSLEASSAVLDVAAAMGIDEVVDPGTTAQVVRRFVATWAGGRRRTQEMPRH